MKPNNNSPLKIVTKESPKAISTNSKKIESYEAIKINLNIGKTKDERKASNHTTRGVKSYASPKFG